MKCYGSTVIGEKGQVVIPAEVRKMFRIKSGDKFLVMADERGPGIMLLRADSLAKFMRHVFGDDLDSLIETGADKGQRARSRSGKAKRARGKGRR
jgi:AbrB family looped-hinge helix DNA binding protein